MKLDIGSGTLQTRREGRGLSCELPLEDWTHLDITPGEHVEIVADFGAIPLESGTVDEVFVGDVIEHVPGWREAEVWCEWNRVMKIGGIIRGRTPNLDRLMRDYAAGELTLNEVLPGIYAGGNILLQHFISYTPDTLRDLLTRYGFGQIDLSQSPGPLQRPWWLVFSAVKLQGVKP